MALLRLENIGKRSGGTWALWDVSLEIEAGEILGVFGRSNSGKTLLARVLAGLEQPTRGSVTCGDAPEPAVSRDDVQTPDTAVPPSVSLGLEKPALAPELTLYENLALFASLWGVRRQSRAKQVSVLLQLVGLAERRSARPTQLSSGEAARVEIARALIADASLTVLDGLLDTLDPDMLEKVWEYLLAQRRECRKSYLVMTGSARVAELCSRMAVIHRGKIVFVGRPDDFRRLGGDDLVVLGELNSPALRRRIEEKLSVVIKEEEGFLSFRVASGDKMISDLLAEFGSDVGCVYLKRPTLDDALQALSTGSPSVIAGTARQEK